MRAAAVSASYTRTTLLDAGFQHTQPVTMTKTYHTFACCRSLECPNRAAEQEPSSQQSSSTERQVLLMQGEARKELNRLRPLINCKKTSSENLKVSGRSIAQVLCALKLALRHILAVCNDWLETCTVEGFSQVG